MSHTSSEKIAHTPVIPAVAAIPPVTGKAPATTGSSPTVALTDAVGGCDQTFSFPVTIYATATITGTFEDEARNTIGCDLRDALADEPAVDLDNGGKLAFTSFKVERGCDAIEARLAGQAYAMLEMIRGFVEHPLPFTETKEGRMAALVEFMAKVRSESRAILARIDGETCASCHREDCGAECLG